MLKEMSAEQTDAGWNGRTSVISASYLEQRLHGLILKPRWLSGQHFHHCATKTPHVRLFIIASTIDHLKATDTCILLPERSHFSLALVAIYINFVQSSKTMVKHVHAVPSQHREHSHSSRRLQCLIFQQYF